MMIDGTYVTVSGFVYVSLSMHKHGVILRVREARRPESASAANCVSVLAQNFGKIFVHKAQVRLARNKQSKYFCRISHS